ncbi:rhomboid family intramembrane serine protease [Mangrovicoccus algicola]|uniref:Rhomboid family intramembrane serine protease n=1 Tax=Mangrovicoccus algicola TaxID=2771008 RepID=A0A8J6ZAX9_9RHOB|nr:rhomboid family intramembrane serine protease [Mangrovicoccus algicola]MBE3639416.1 rhomboid family intramembrane serine protease [Mangrovicoccus algicola]
MSLRPQSRPPAAVNPLPASVLGLAVVIFGIECLFELADRGIIGGTGGMGLRLGALEHFAFYGQALDWMLTNQRFPPELLARLVTYPLLHVGFVQAVMACVFILAIGKMVGEAFGNVAVLAIFFGASVGGALAYGLILDATYPLIGAFPGVYGLIGGFTFMQWVRQKAVGESQMRAFQLIGLLLAIQLIFGALFGAGQEWVADIAGFVCGFGLSFLFVPGGWARLRDRLRSR